MLLLWQQSPGIIWTTSFYPSVTQYWLLNAVADPLYIWRVKNVTVKCQPKGLCLTDDRWLVVIINSNCRVFVYCASLLTCSQPCVFGNSLRGTTEVSLIAHVTWVQWTKNQSKGFVYWPDNLKNGHLLLVSVLLMLFTVQLGLISWIGLWQFWITGLINVVISCWCYSRKHLVTSSANR